MSEIDKNDPRGKKPFYIKDRDDRFLDTKKISNMTSKLDMKENRFMKSRGSIENGEKPINSPKIMLRRDGDILRSHSANQTSHISVVSKQMKDETPTLALNASYNGVPKSNISSINSAANLSIPQMSKSACLLEDGNFTGDRLLEYLTDQSDFLVIGCLGPQGVGKSMLLSNLAGKSDEKSVFKVQSAENIISCSHCTSNIDVYITENRIFFLDTPPVLSPSLMDKNNGQESTVKKSTTIASQIFVPSVNAHSSVDLPPPENSVEIYSLQVASFILSVCHVVILMQDWFYDPNIVRLLQSAEMLKPPLQTGFNDNDTTEYFPHVILLQNKAQLSDYIHDSVVLMQEIYNQMFVRSQLHIRSGIGIANGRTIADLNVSTCGDLVNLYLLPDIENEDNENSNVNCHSSYKYLLEKFKRDLFGITKNSLTQMNLTEKNWFQYSSQVWDIIKKNTFFMEYDKLLSPP